MGYGRKKRNLTAIPLTSPPVGSSSSYYRPPPPITTGAGASNGNGAAEADRSSSPPASAYFPLLSADTNARLRPTPDAEAHFAYSTTLRRHHSDGAALSSPTHFAAAVEAEATSLWKRAILTITGQPEDTYQQQDRGFQRATGGGIESGLGGGGGQRSSPLAGGQQKDQKKDTISARFAHYGVEVRLPTTLVGFPVFTDNEMVL